MCIQACFGRLKCTKLVEVLIEFAEDAGSNPATSTRCFFETEEQGIKVGSSLASEEGMKGMECF